MDQHTVCICGHTREIHDFLGCSMRRCRCAGFSPVKGTATSGTNSNDPERKA